MVYDLVKAGAGREQDKSSLAALTLGVLGIVFGDIGTSPLYALRESLHGLPITTTNVLGVLSLIFWVLVLIISIKYLALILRADNKGEGGVLALFALLKEHYKRYNALFLLLAVIGSGLLLGDAMLTPAISVLSAVEGLSVISPHLNYLIIPATIIILVLLFLHQKYGTESIGRWFGPLILSWFIAIGALGVPAIIKSPFVLSAINPWWAVQFFMAHHLTALATLGGVFLVVTGGEALYADLGHFGRQPIQLGWFSCVLPCLLLNYFGQGALLLQHPDLIANPFYALAPAALRYPLLALATCATIIASQAVISAIFSLARQAMLLNLMPKMHIIQTSSHTRGQIYIPKMNLLLAFGTICLVVAFGHSSNLASAYGIAVNLDMLVVTLLVTMVARKIWRWSLITTLVIFGIIILIESMFFAANAMKIMHGGWIPLCIALVCMVIMLTWYNGIRLLYDSFHKKQPALEPILQHLVQSNGLQVVPKLTAIFIADLEDYSARSLLHFLRLTCALPERVILLNVVIEDQPYITDFNRYTLQKITNGFYHLILHYGFMQFVNIPEAIDQINKRNELPLKIDQHHTTYFIETRHVLLTLKPQKHLAQWQKRLFVYLQHNALVSIEFYQLSTHRTISIGAYYEI